MNRLDRQTRELVIHMLCEGSSMRAVSRVTGCSKNTVMKLLVNAGQVCSIYQDEVLRKLRTRRIQIDEIWSFCYAKKKNVGAAKAAPEGAGDVWTWTALDADSRLLITWLVGTRSQECAIAFLEDLAARVPRKGLQLSSDAYAAYEDVVDQVFGPAIHYGQLVKVFDATSAGHVDKNSPAPDEWIYKTSISGKQDENHISTSYIERYNLTMRTNIRWFTRRTIAFSKKVENHAYAVSLHAMYYNFCRIHQTLRVTPAMEAGVTKKLWKVEDIVALIEEKEEVERPKERGPYKKKAAA